MYQHILLEKKGGAVRLTLNRPEVYNALNETLCREIQQALKEINEDKTIKVLILTGAGKGFCSGLDLKSINIKDASVSDVVKELFNPIVTGIKTLNIPVIALINGPAVGAGCSLALAADMVIANENATFGFTFVNIGLIPDTGISYFLPRLAGNLKAFELFALGKTILATEAQQYGLVNSAVKVEELEETVDKLVAYFATAPTKAIGFIKKLVTESSENTLSSMLDQEAKFQEKAAHTNDFKEGVAAFVTKRKPDFKGE
ncbi:enoyl-CoA hydratase/isomerase family protein [Sporocytophaga myxococcoides]|uniref:enoyl-CoA hydratase/isomerase family protein n=1 Tax=Sporocytophaga myxococcoides TaxID=153721 RepID=UPI000404F34E|nr:enoyl-CoA hydratase-related protein [Sporocytophaga myxococcoides]